MNVGISNWHNSSFDSTKMKFFTLFQFLARLLTSNLFKLISTYSLGKMEWCEKRAFQLLKRILTSTHMKNLIFFCIIYVAMSNIHFSGLDKVKWLANHISTKVSFKISIRKRHVYIDIRWHWKWNQYFYLAIWEDERSKIIFLPSFQLVARLNSQNRNERSLLMKSDTLFVYEYSHFQLA